MKSLTFLGTSHAMPINSSCSSTLVEDDQNHLLIDVGGGHDLLVQLHRAKKDPNAIKNVFISHAHSDHILGIVPLVRSFSKQLAPRTIFCSQEVKDAMDSLFSHVATQYYELVQPTLHVVIIKDGSVYEEGGWQMQFFDLKSAKAPQFGCVINFSDKTKLSFLGDEPLRDHCFDTVRNSDVLIHEAFCLDVQQDQFDPHPKTHSTVKEAALNATKANAKKLVFFHMEDETLATRKELYAQEASEYFKGEIIVPVDLDRFEF